jgi:hypothetical protein
MLLGVPAVAGFLTFVKIPFANGFSTDSGVPSVVGAPDVQVVICASVGPAVAVFLMLLFPPRGPCWLESLMWLSSLLLLMYLLLLVFPMFPASRC